MYKVIKRGDKPIIEQFENESVLITRFLLTGETETVIKAGADQKVKDSYKKLNAERLSVKVLTFLRPKRKVAL